MNAPFLGAVALRTGLPGFASVTFTVSALVFVTPVEFTSSAVYTYVPFDLPAMGNTVRCAFGVLRVTCCSATTTPFSSRRTMRAFSPHHRFIVML